MGEDFKNADNAFTVVLILGIVAFSVTLGLYALIFCFFITCDKTAHIIFVVLGFLETDLLIALTVFFCKAIYYLARIDPARLTFFAENQCSEGPLQVAFVKLADDLSNDKVKAGVGLLFTLLSFIAVITTLIFQTGIRDKLLPKYR